MNPNDEKRFQRIMAIDYLKAIAIILVILTHAMSKVQRLKVGGPFWISMAVPIFMIISGFTNSMSADRKNIESLSQSFKVEELLTKLSRILLPYLIIVFVELFLGISQRILLDTGPFISFTLKDFLLFLLTGGIKPGSYYIVILLQFTVIYPLMLQLFQKSAKQSICLFFSIHFLFDMITNYSPIPGKIYRLLIFRYLAFIIMGIALYYSSHKVRKNIKWLGVSSVVYIWIYAYLGYVPKVFAKWTNTSLPTVFWATTLVILGMNYLEREDTNLLTKLFSEIGQASYHIFLVQKLLFGFGLNKFLIYLNISSFLHVVFSVVICCGMGMFFRNKLNSNLRRFL